MPKKASIKKSKIASKKIKKTKKASSQPAVFVYRPLPKNIISRGHVLASIKNSDQKKNKSLSFNPLLALQGVFVFTITLIALFSFSNIFFSQTKVDQTLVIQKSVSKPTEVFVAGQPIKYITLVKKSDITLGQYLAKLPKGAENIQIKIISQTESQKILTQTKPKNTLTQDKRKILAESVKSNSKPNSLLASISGGFKFLFADLEEAVSSVVEQIVSSEPEPQAESALETIETSDAVYVDLSSEVKEEKQEVKEEAKEEKAEAKADKKSEETIDELEIAPEIVEAPVAEEAVTEPAESLAPASPSQGEDVQAGEEPVEEMTETPVAEEDEVIAIEYEAQAPEITERAVNTGKVITISAEESPNQPALTDVVAFTTIPEIYKVGQEKNIKIKWQNNGNQDMQFDAHDLDNNGKLDYVEWTVPHLSDQIFEVIFISKAFRLDANKEITEDIYEYVQAQDNTWATLNDGEYIRVTFEQTLNDTKDITVYAKPTNPDQSPTIEVYTENGTDLIAEFLAIDHEDIYKIYLTDLQTPTDTFDLKIIGDIDFDYIVDPVGWLAGWSYRKKITIDNTNVGADLTDFPLQVKILSDADIIAHAQEDGDDIRFTSNDGTTLLPYEEEKWSYGSDDYFWVKTDVDHDASTDIYVYYGKADAEDGQSATDVWDTNFKGVWHMNNSASPALDSTSNNNDGAQSGGVTFDAVGKIDGATRFDGDNDYLDAGSSIPLDSNNWTMEFFWKPTSIPSLARALSYYGDGPTIWWSSGAVNVVHSGTVDFDCNITAETGTWQQITVTRGSNDIACYLDGLPTASSAVFSKTYTADTSVHIGNSTAYGEPFPGTIDEARISSVKRSASWVEFEYYNINEADAELTFAVEEEPPAEICDNAIDDDSDGYTDCGDADCFADAACGDVGRYWVGGTGNWSDTAHWSEASGGEGGASVPDEITDWAEFNANSGSGTATINVGSVVLDSLYVNGNITLDTSTNGIIVAYELAVNSEISGATTVELVNNLNVTILIGGSGTISAPIEIGDNSTISDVADITISGTMTVGETITVTNNGTATITNMGSGTGAWTQGENSTLNYLGASITPTLSASAVGNTVKYSGATANVVMTTYDKLTLIDATNNSTDTVMTFDNTGTVSVTGLLTIDGMDANDRVNLVSDSPGDQWSLEAGSFAIDYIEVTDSNNIGETQPTYTDTLNGGNNTNWGFNTTPNIPVRISPEDESYTATTTPTLSATYSDDDTGDTGFTNYGIATSAENCLAETFVAGCGGTCIATSSETATNDEATEWTPSESIGDGGVYYWCAQNDDNVAQSAWTSMGSFTLDATNPGVTITSPTNSTNYNSTSVSFATSESDDNSGFIVPNLDSSLVSWWRMDDVDGSGNPTDYIGDNDGTKQGNATQTNAGKFGKAFTFDGTGDYVSTSDIDVATGTLSAWVKRGVTGARHFVMGETTTAADKGQAYWFEAHSSNKLLLIIGNGVSNNTAFSTGTIADTNWHHVAVTFNGTNIIFYIDGSASGSSSQTIIPQDINVNFQIGQSMASGYYVPMNGFIDEAMIFNRALTADEITALYDATAISHSSTLSEGSHAYTAYSSDLAGNIGSSGPNTFVVDATVPTTDVNLNGYTTNTWTSSSVTVDLTCQDTGGSGCSKIYACEDSGSACDPTAGTDYDSPKEFSYTTTGTTTLRWKSKDTATNWQTTEGSVIVKIDKTTPDITAVDAGASSSDRTSLTSNTWFKYSATGDDDQISFSFTDPSSVSDDTFYYELNATATATISGDETTTTNPYIDSITITEGTNYMHVKPKTGAGTWGTERTFIVKYDKTAPTTSDNFTNDDVWVNEAQPITLTPNCDASGCAWTKYCTNAVDCDPSGGTAYTVPVEISTEGTSYFRYASQDNAGNTQTTVSLTLKIDTILPTLTGFDPASGSTLDDADSLTIAFTTDENATCRISFIDRAYGDMSIACDGAGTTDQSCTITDLGADGEKDVFIACIDTLTNADTIATNENLTYTLSTDTSGPTVSAGADQSVSSEFTQTGTATDDSGVSTYAWAMISGPGTISFGSANSAETTISASTDGTYIIRLTATDTLDNSATDDFTLTWSTPYIPGQRIQQITQIFTPTKEQQIIYPPIEEVVTEETPEAFNPQDFELNEPITEWNLSLMPSDAAFFAGKFSQFGKVLNGLGIKANNIGDVKKLVGTDLAMPGLTEAILPKDLSGIASLKQLDAIPLSQLSSSAKQGMPTDIIFARAVGELIDYKTKLAFDEKGNAEQRINVISGKPVQLVFKPDAPAKKVLGYVFLRKSNQGAVIPSPDLGLAKYFAAALIAGYQESVNPAQNSVSGLLVDKFEYTLAGSGIYEAEIKAPIAEGEYEISTIVEYEDKEIGPKETKLIALVDPEGYVYSQLKKGRLRVGRAEVSIYWQNPETKKYELWDAVKYLQKNPVFTDETGRYSFLVPEGRYYLTAKAKGYFDYKSQDFQVIQEVGIHQDIKMEESTWWNRTWNWMRGIFVKK